MLCVLSWAPAEGVLKHSCDCCSSLDYLFSYFTDGVRQFFENST